MGFYATKWNNVVADSVCIVGPLVCGGLCLVLVLLSSIKCLFLFSLSFFCNHLAGVERVGCFTLIILLVPCGS